MMTRPRPSLCLKGATVLWEGAMQDRPVAMTEGRITTGTFPDIDLEGFWILPGIVDLHGDAFERHIAPRPSAPFPVEHGLRSVDRDAATHGVTTAWLAQSWSWEGGMRGPDHAERVAAALASYRSEALVDLRLQIRFETHEVESADRLVTAVRQFGIDYVIFNDHLAEAEAMWATRPHDVELWARRGGRSGAALMEVVRAARARAREVPRMLCRLAESFDAMGVTYGSHDDPDGETREFFSRMGARICEFPTQMPAAAVARSLGDPVLMGAPNVVRGGSQAGNIAAKALIQRGKCDGLVSDYHYPALAQAAFALIDQGVMDLPRAWALISANPARIMRLADRGVIAPGLRADLTIINRASRAVEATVVDGRIAYLAGEAAERFMGLPRALCVAAE